jgi:hypothetical protein
MRQHQSGQLPTGTSNGQTLTGTSSICCGSDTPAFISTSAQPQVQRSAGMTNVVAIPLNGPTPQQKWKFISASVQAYLGLSSGAYDGANYHSETVVGFGKLERIIAAIDPSNPLGQSGFSPGANNQPWSVAVELLPSDSTLQCELWNPAEDPLPPACPFYYGGPTGITPPTPQQLLPISGLIMPPNPIELIPGQSPYLGIWMLPSLLGARSIGVNAVNNFFGLSMYYGSWTINYDDGT